jgi:hypothetical protein
MFQIAVHIFLDLDTENSFDGKFRFSTIFSAQLPMTLSIFFFPDVARLQLFPVVRMFGLGPQTKPCLRVVAIIVCVTLVSMFYLLGFGQPMQFIRASMQTDWSNGERKKDMPSPRKDLSYSVMTLARSTVVLRALCGFETR